MSAASELDAAGISGAALRASYLRCRHLNAHHGKTYFLATMLLPAAKRPYVHALYGFARHADDLVDEHPGPGRAEHFARWSQQFLTDLDWGATSDPLCRAVLDTAERWSIPHSYFADFLDSMRMDLSVTGYATFDDLLGYVWGSAAVIGLQMLPVLGTMPGMASVAAPYACDLGVGFQLTNFIRDVGEDQERGRLYLPKDELAFFGVTRDDLATSIVDANVRRLLAFQIARARELLRSAEPGIRLLHPTSRDCIHTAATLYGGILDEVEAADYRVLDQRVSVGLRRRTTVAVPALIRARRARSRQLT
jgi:phytoene synthase